MTLSHKETIEVEQFYRSIYNAHKYTSEVPKILGASGAVVVSFFEFTKFRTLVYMCSNLFYNLDKHVRF